MHYEYILNRMQCNNKIQHNNTVPATTILISHRRSSKQYGAVRHAASSREVPIEFLLSLLLVIEYSIRELDR